MADDQTRDELVQLRAQLAEQEARFTARLAHLERPRRVPRRHLRGRFLPLALVALLVVLTPLALLAASPFNDLTGGVHDANIGLLYDAGITRGCVPDVSYCPTDTVTRQEMASFLARTAGLGTNPPVVNAKTAQTAALATNATNAVNAQTATNATNATHAGSADTATNATTATNAAALGGQPPSAYLPSTGTTTLRYPGNMVVNTVGGTLAPNFYGGAILTLVASAGSILVVPLPRPTAQFGRFLAITSVRVCYVATGAGINGIKIDSTAVFTNERGSADDTALVNDPTDRVATGHECYDVAVAPQAVAGMDYAYIVVQNGPGATRTLTFDSFALTLTPLAAGAAEVPPVADPNAPAKP